MRPAVYLETTIVSYLMARPSRDLLVAARQAVTAHWWKHRRVDFDTFVSAVVLREARKGDPEAAGKRMEALSGIPALDVSRLVLQFAEAIKSKLKLPRTAAEDALHIAVAAAHGMDYLLTWNCTHIANAELFRGVMAVSASYGFQAPVICTPEELMGHAHLERPHRR